MSNKPIGYYEGRDVRINFDTKEVTVRKVVGDKRHKQEIWVNVPLHELSLNTWYSQSIENKDGRFSIKDIGLNLQAISSGLEVMRLDSESAVRIWSNLDAIKGKNIALDFSTCEIALKPSPFVFPFTAVAGVIDEDFPQIVYKHHGITNGKYPTIGILLSAVELAKRLGVPIIS